MDKAENAMQNFVKAADVVEKFGADGIITNFFGSEINKDGLYLSYPDYICNCSRQKIKNILLTMGKSQLMSIINEQGDVCVHCHYCNTDYRFVKEDIEELFKDE
jgi:molecular chaperone Hsp33